MLMPGGLFLGPLERSLRLGPLRAGNPSSTGELSALCRLRSTSTPSTAASYPMSTVKFVLGLESGPSSGCPSAVATSVPRRAIIVTNCRSRREVMIMNSRALGSLELLLGVRR
jgi:hypothetical protein